MHTNAIQTLAVYNINASNMATADISIGKLAYGR